MIVTSGKLTLFIPSLAPGKDGWSAYDFRLGGFGQPLLNVDRFMGLECATGINTAGHTPVSLGEIVGALNSSIMVNGGGTDGHRLAAN